MHRVWPGSATVGAAKEPAALIVKRAASLQIFFHVVCMAHAKVDDGDVLRHHIAP